MKIKHYSSGMRARLAFATAMQIDPDIYLIDEILAVGDWAFKMKSNKSLHSLKKRKKTVLLATHNLDQLPELADNVMLLHKGRLDTIGKPEEVIKKYKEIKSLN